MLDDISKLLYKMAIFNLVFWLNKENQSEITEILQDAISKSNC